MITTATQPAPSRSIDATAKPKTTATIVPTKAVRTFGIDEIIVSKTDPLGRITYVNDVFLRVSGYAEAEVIGRPHNMIRHPDMPRVVFALLWEEIQAGREIFAYVKNMAVDGAAYWVFAHVTPTFLGREIVGYHSNRRSPLPRAVQAIEPIYQNLVAVEARHTRPSEAIAASRQVLHQLLAEHQVTYDQFVWSLAASSGRGR